MTPVFLAVYRVMTQDRRIERWFFAVAVECPIDFVILERYSVQHPTPRTFKPEIVTAEMTGFFTHFTFQYDCFHACHVSWIEVFNVGRFSKMNGLQSWSTITTDGKSHIIRTPYTRRIKIFMLHKLICTPFKLNRTSRFRQRL